LGSVDGTERAMRDHVVRSARQYVKAAIENRAQPVASPSAP
jgi:hypothetical protein